MDLAAISAAFNIAKISLFIQSCSPACPADLNSDGLLDFFDVGVFLAFFTNGDPAADINDDGTLDFFDVSAFLAAYQAGCS